MAEIPLSAATSRAPVVRVPVLLAVFALGASCVITQLVLMRELFSAFAGNELVLGVALGNWLLLMGLGAALGRWAPRIQEPFGVLAALLVFTAILPPAQVVALRGLRSLLFLRGAEFGVSATVLVSFVVLLPYCLAAGFLLALACRLLVQGGDERGAGRVYVADSLGSIAGGALFSFALVRWLDHCALLSVPAVLNLVVAFWLAVRMRTRREAGSAWLLASAPLLAVGLLALVLFANPDAASTALQFPGQRVLFRGNSPYGRLVVTDTAGQINFLENGLAVASTPNIEAAEETAHYALAQRPGARRVLLVSGALSGAAREILRYGVGELDCVELDPLVIAAGRRFLPQEFADPWLRVVTTDARRFVRRTRATYDIVILALPDPTTAQINRFFTAEFFAETKRILVPGGVLAFAVGRYENYVSPGLRRLLSCARQTAARSFRNVVLIPGGRVYFLASDGPVHADIAATLDRLRLRTRLVNRNYLAALLAPDRLADVNRAAAQPAPVNRDFSPRLYLLSLRHWASQFQMGFGVLQIILVVLFGVYLARLRGPALTIFASGFGAASLEMVLLLGLQILAGSLYQQVGLVVTLFMTGLAVGAFVANRSLASVADESGAGFQPVSQRSDRRSLRAPRAEALGCLAFAIAALAALLPVWLLTLDRLGRAGAGNFVVPAVIGGMTLILAALVGAQFPLANAASGTPEAAARLYTADFVGACLGALLPSTLLVPLFGVAGACWLTAGLNLLGGFAVWRPRTAA